MSYLARLSEAQRGQALGRLATNGIFGLHLGLVLSEAKKTHCETPSYACPKCCQPLLAVSAKARKVAHLPGERPRQRAERRLSVTYRCRVCRADVAGDVVPTRKARLRRERREAAKRAAWAAKAVPTRAADGRVNKDSGKKKKKKRKKEVNAGLMIPADLAAAKRTAAAFEPKRKGLVMDDIMREMLSEKSGGGDDDDATAGGNLSSFLMHEKE